MWIAIFFSRVRRFGNDFHEWQRHEWKSLVNRLTGEKKSLFTVTNVLFYFLHAILCNEHTNPLRTIIERSFRHCCQGRPFLTEHCDVTTIDLWRHANAKYWYCDVIFVYCHCTRKLAQRRSSLMNNSREYRYLATRYSRLSVHCCARNLFLPGRLKPGFNPVSSTRWKKPANPGWDHPLRYGQ